MKKIFESPKTEFFTLVKSNILCASNSGQTLTTGQGGGYKNDEPTAAPGRVF